MSKIWPQILITQLPLRRHGFETGHHITKPKHMLGSLTVVMIDSTRSHVQSMINQQLDTNVLIYGSNC